jgi:two-component system invasion response regulator UvrY
MTIPQRPYRIAMVDDHLLLRDALAEVLARFDEFEIVLLAANGKEFMEKLQTTLPPDLVLLDLNMPEINGFETTDLLRDKYPSILVLALTMYDSELAVLRILKAGAHGFLKKDIHPLDLRRAINYTIENGFYYSRNATNKMFNLIRNSDTKQSTLTLLGLNDNEMQFLRHAATEMTYKEIASLMNVSVRMIDHHRDSLFQKLGVRSRVGLVLFAVKNGLANFTL